MCHQRLASNIIRLMSLNPAGPVGVHVLLHPSPSLNEFSPHTVDSIASGCTANHMPGMFVSRPCDAQGSLNFGAGRCAVRGSAVRGDRDQRLYMQPANNSQTSSQSNYLRGIRSSRGMRGMRGIASPRLLTSSWKNIPVDTSKRGGRQNT